MQRRRVVFALVVTLCGLLGSAGTGRADEDTALVAKWYRAYLKREPGTSVLEAYASELKNGTPASDVQATLLGSNEYFDRANRDPETFVAALYTDVIGRAGTPAEVRTWVDALRRLNGDRQELARQFLRSSARPGQPWRNESDLDAIRGWYRKYLGREAAPTDVNTWIKYLEQGWSILDVQAGILGSDEFFNRYRRDPARFIAGLYAEILGVNPWPDDLRYWQGILRDLNDNREALARRALQRLVGPPKQPLPPDMPRQPRDVAARLVLAIEDLQQQARSELSGTPQGRRVLLRVAALVDAGQQFRDLVQQRGYSMDQLRQALETLERDRQAVLDELTSPPGTAPRCAQAARDVGNLVAAGTAILPPLPPQVVSAAAPAPRIVFDIDPLLRLLRPLARDNRHVLSLVRGLTEEGVAYQGLTRDVDAFAELIEQFRNQVRPGAALSQLQTAFSPLQRQERRIDRDLATVNASGALRQGWWQVGQDMAEVAASLGVSRETADRGEAVLKTRPAPDNLSRALQPGDTGRIPATVVNQADDAIAEVDALLANLRPLVLTNAAVPRLQVEARNLRNALVQFRQAAAIAVMRQDLSGYLRDVTGALERAHRQWERVAGSPLANTAQWTRIDQVIEQLRQTAR